MQFVTRSRHAVWFALLAGTWSWGCLAGWGSAFAPRADDEAVPRESLLLMVQIFDRAADQALADGDANRARRCEDEVERLRAAVGARRTVLAH